MIVFIQNSITENKICIIDLPENLNAIPPVKDRPVQSNNSSFTLTNTGEKVNAC